MPKGWRKEQSRDRFFRQAKAEGYRARSAYKLLELDAKFRLLGPGKAVLDLGAAPGSWTQVALQRGGGQGRVVAVDLQEIAPLAGATTLQGDIGAPEVQAAMAAALPRGADVVLSDVSPKVSGIAITDHARSIELAEASLAVAERFLKPGGSFAVKIFMGEDFNAFLARVRQRFAKVHAFQPEASRDESRERYIIGLGYRGPEPGPASVV
ncbi:MAG: RlmE family RNA methyltransferase [Chloroflexota bacterium]